MRPFARGLAMEVGAAKQMTVPASITQGKILKKKRYLPCLPPLVFSTIGPATRERTKAVPVPISTRTASSPAGTPRFTCINVR